MPTEHIVAAALVIAGGSLAATGALRLTRIAMRDMPRLLAAAVVVAGTAVIGAGIAYPGMIAGNTEPAAETLPLEPVPTPGSDTADDPAERTRIEGTIRRHDGTPLADAPVTLQRFEGTEPVEEAESTTDADGAFTFTDLPSGPTTAYTVGTTFDTYPYRSELLRPRSGAAVEVEMIVAEVTEDASVLEVELDSMVLVADRQGAQVVQVLSVRNTGDRAYTAGLRLPLLPGAAGLETRSGLDRTRLAVVDEDLVSLSPVLPGETQIVYTYGVPMARSGLTVDRTVRHPTERIEVLLSGDLGGLESDVLRDEGELRLGSEAHGSPRRYRRFGAADLGPRDRIEATALLDEPNRTLATALVVAAVVLAVGIFVYPLWRRRRAASAPTDDPESR